MSDQLVNRLAAMSAHDGNWSYFKEVMKGNVDHYYCLGLPFAINGWQSIDSIHELAEGCQLVFHSHPQLRSRYQSNVQSALIAAVNAEDVEAVKLLLDLPALNGAVSGAKKALLNALIMQKALKSSVSQLYYGGPTYLNTPWSKAAADVAQQLKRIEKLQAILSSH